MLSSWFYPKPTGDVGRDRNARTLHFSCLLFAFALGAIAVVDMIAGVLVHCRYCLRRSAYLPQRP